jgi:phosphate transport system substrate-binding protein
MLASSPDGVPVLENRNVTGRRFVMALGVVALCGLVLALVAGGSSDRVVGAGSTFAYPLIQRASEAYQTALAGSEDWTPGSSGVDYEPVGSLGGVLRLSDPEVDFAVSDYPLSPKTAEASGYVQFPIAVGSLTPIYNFGDATAPALKLRAATLAEIYLGRVTNWSDPAIQESNPGVALPDLPIRVVYRAEGSGSTLNWTTYLSSASAAWRDAHGAETLIDWPTGEGVRGSEEMAAAVSSTPGAIGYLETGQAQRAGLAMAEVENAQGRFVAATPDSIDAAARFIDWTADARARAGTAGAAAVTNPDAYPIVTAAYVIMKRGNSSAADNARTLRFIAFIFDQGAADVESLGFLPLPQDTIDTVKTIWARELTRES